MSKNRIHDLIMIILGNFVVACSVSFFILPNNILTGGVAGVAVALHPVLPIDTVLMIDGLTIGLFILGALLLGKQFAMKSVISTIVYPVFVTGLSQVATMFPKDTFVMPAYVATIYAGVLVGIGLGLVFRVNSSTGGMDILALVLHKYLKIPEGTQPNTKFRLKGKGVKSRSGQGDEFVEVQVEIPRKVSRRERELYEELKSGQAESPFERFKRAFK